MRGGYVAAIFCRRLDAVSQPLYFVGAAIQLHRRRSGPTVAGTYKVGAAVEISFHSQWLWIDHNDASHGFWTKPHCLSTFHYGNFICHKRVYFGRMFSSPLLSFLLYAVV